MRVAVVDLGTNSTRLLVADVRGGEVGELERRTDVTRLGEGVDASGRLAESAVARVVRAVEGYVAAIERHGAKRSVAVATSAVRDAENGDDLRALLAERFGIDARTLSGEQEARLTFLGATSGRAGGGGRGGRSGGDGGGRRGDGEPTLVIDIGGGSTEYVVGRPGEAPDFHVSTQAGSVRQTERHVATDPPSTGEVEAMAAEVRGIVEGAVPPAIRAATRHGIAVAGTPTSLAAVEQALDPYDPERVHGYPLRLDGCRRMLEQLAGLPLERRRRVTGLHPDRAPTIVAGAVILVESMRAFRLDVVETSEADILHGAALSVAKGRWPPDG